MKMNLRGAMRHAPGPSEFTALNLSGDGGADSGIHPALAGALEVIDWKKYRLGRLQSEMRTGLKASGFEKRVVPGRVR